MTEDELDFDSVSISVAGIDYVENTLGKESPTSFFQDLVIKHPKLEAQLMAWLAFEEKERGRRNIRDVVFFLLQHTLDQFVEIEENQSCKESAKDG